MVTLILRSDVDNVGKKGDVVDVSDGFGRNFLVAKGLAMKATPGAVSQATGMRRARAVKDARDRESAEQVARVLVTGRLEQRSWETPDGEKRSKIEVVADEIGPSLRWAPAEIRKNDRRGPGDGGGQAMNGGARPVANAAPAPSGGGAAPTYDYGDEPF